MKRIILLLIIILIGETSHCQIRDKRLICDPNPTVINKLNRKIVNNKVVDSTYTIRILRCVKSSPLGLKLEAGYSRYYYNRKTADWLGQHGGPNFGLTFIIENTKVGFKFRPWTLYPKKSLDINGNVLPITTKLNPIKTDYLLSYNFNLKGNFTFEPTLGYTRSSFVILNEDKTGYSFSIPKTGGLLAGISARKYLTIKYNEFLSIFGNVEYAFVDYSKVSSDLGFGYFDLTLGIAFNGYFKKLVLKRI
jgi:hypothetical protein